MLTQTLDECFDQAFGVVPSTAQTDLARSAEFDRQMSAMYQERYRRESEEKAAIANAVRSRDPAAMDRVIEGAQYNSDYRYAKAALALAVQGPEAGAEALKPARASSDRSLGANAAQADQEAFSRFNFLQALQSTMGAFPTGSTEWNRMHSNYCDNLTQLRDALLTPNYAYLQDPANGNFGSVPC